MALFLALSILLVPIIGGLRFSRQGQSKHTFLSVGIACIVLASAIEYLPDLLIDGDNPGKMSHLLLVPLYAVGTFSVVLGMTKKSPKRLGTLSGLTMNQTFGELLRLACVVLGAGGLVLMVGIGMALYGWGEWIGFVICSGGALICFGVLLVASLLGSEIRHFTLTGWSIVRIAIELAIVLLAASSGASRFSDYTDNF